MLQITGITSNNMKKGFTLIELLVVIAIILILTSVVLTSIGDKKKKITPPKSTTPSTVASVDPTQRDPAIEESDRRINSCLEGVASERERIQKRFQEEMSDLDDKVSRQCFNNYSR